MPNILSKIVRFWLTIRFAIGFLILFYKKNVDMKGVQYYSHGH